jgi:hypothetical protein
MSKKMTGESAKCPRRLFSVERLNEYSFDIKARAEFAVDWLLKSVRDRPWGTPTVKESNGRIVVAGLDARRWAYLPAGLRRRDDPWSNNPNDQGFDGFDEGLVFWAACPRHGGTRRSDTLYTPSPLELSNAQYVSGQPWRCSLCSGVAVYKRNENDPGSSQYCAFCCERRFQIPKKLWSEPKCHPVFDLEKFRESTRLSLKGLEEWGADVECESCVTSVYCSVGGPTMGTHEMLVRTYKRR